MPPRARLNTIACAALLVTALTATHAAAESPAILIGRDLKPLRVRLLAIGNGRVFYSTADNVLRDTPIGTFGRIMLLSPEELGASVDDEAGKVSDGPQPTRSLLDLTRIFGGRKAPAQLDPAKVDPAKPSAGSPALLELADGQRLIGELAAGGDDERLVWKHAALGEVAVRLDAIRAIAFDSKPVDAAAATTDQLLLSNGDHLSGFGIAVRPTGVEFQIGGQKQAIAVPIDRVRVIILANPIHAIVEATDHIVYLRGGDRVRARDFRVDDDALVLAPTLLPADKTVSIPLAQVRRIDIASSSGRVVDLVDVPRRVTAGGEVFGVETQPRAMPDDRPLRLATDALWLHAPVTVAFDAPKGASQLAFRAELDRGDLKTVASATGWADMELIVRVDGAEAGRYHIDPKSPSAVVNVPAGRRIELQLDTAANGPVLDRLLLRDAIIFVGSDAK